MIEDQNTIDELTGKVQELQNEINCMNDSRDFKDAESVRSGQLSHVPSEPVLFPLPTDPGGLLSRARNLQPHNWNTPGVSGKRCKFTCILVITLFENFLCME